MTMKNLFKIFCIALVAGVLASAEGVQSQRSAVATSKASTPDEVYLIDAQHLSLDFLTKAMTAAMKQQTTSPSLSGAVGQLTGGVQTAWETLKKAVVAVLPERATRLFSRIDNEVDIKKRYEQFKQFMTTYRRSYNPAELSKRFTAFISHMSMIEESVKNYEEGQSTYKLGLNEFADRDDSELAKMAGKANPQEVAEDDEFNADFNNVDESDYESWSNSAEGKMVSFKSYAPASKDWRTSGCLGEVLNQGSCGSCYIFSTLQTIQAMNCLRTNGSSNFQLAPQQGVDCISSGCEGGFERYVINHYNSKGKMALERCYPYQGKSNRYCQLGYKTYNSGCSVSASIDGQGGPLKMKKVTGHNSIIDALGTIGPLAGGVYAPRDMYSYMSGIYDGRRCPPRAYQNHAVVLAGYGEENGVKFWLMKNSWGPKWGDNGYIKVKRGNNECSVEQEAFIVYNKPTYDYHYT